MSHSYLKCQGFRVSPHMPEGLHTPSGCYTEPRGIFNCCICEKKEMLTSRFQAFFLFCFFKLDACVQFSHLYQSEIWSVKTQVSCLGCLKGPLSNVAQLGCSKSTVCQASWACWVTSGQRHNISQQVRTLWGFFLPFFELDQIKWLNLRIDPWCCERRALVKTS